jgi:hypothetical protein
MRTDSTDAALRSESIFALWSETDPVVIYEKMKIIRCHPTISRTAAWPV